MREHLAERADQWFAKARAASLDSLPCRSGCSRCCIGPFAITVLDIERLQYGRQSMPTAQRAEIHRRASDQVASIEEAFPRLSDTPFLDSWPDAEIDRLVTAYQDVPCPALEADGTCAVYAWRPLTCRLMGIPTVEGALVQGACQVQTAVPILRLPHCLRQQEDAIAEQEAETIDVHQQRALVKGEEVLLPYGFLDHTAGHP